VTGAADDPTALIDIDPRSPVAPYEQLRARIALLVREGGLPAHTRLPPVRRLATDLGLAANTVARAYRELEAGGILETRGRLGTFVRAPGTALPDPAREAAVDYAERMRALGVPPERALDLARAALADG
jgi:DNA-binding transcriptional regulator YhcF (GntR family)